MLHHAWSFVQRSAARTLDFGTGEMPRFLKARFAVSRRLRTPVSKALLTLMHTPQAMLSCISAQTVQPGREILDAM